MLKLSQKFIKHYNKESKKLIWNKPPKFILKKKKNNHYDWFPDGKINVYENCISNNLKKNKKKIAIITVDRNKKITKYSFKQIDEKVNSISNFIIRKKNYRKLKVMIHSSASLESSILMLSCAKLGIHFSVIFEELETLGIYNRIKLYKPNIFFTRCKKRFFAEKIKLKKTKKISFVYGEKLKKILQNTENNKKIDNKIVSSSKDMFTLFTSGSTGAPKGITHSTGGYLLYAKQTCKNQFNMNENSIVLTASDAGWINGHTYSLFGPLSLGCTTVLMEKPISLVDIELLKKLLELKISILYLPVTLIRIIKSHNKKFKINKRYLETIGSMGEPLAPAVGEWFAKKFLNKKKSVVNTYFQTETGGIICSPKFNQNISQVPHGSVGKPLSDYIKLNKLDKEKVKEIKILLPWPGMMKSVINGKKEWNKYWDKNGYFRLFDLATKKKNNIFIHGRNDDVVNIRGHRIGSEEIESTILKLKQITECCVITLSDKIEGSKIYLFIVSNKNLDIKIENLIISNFGSYALPKKIFYVNQLPKTRSGKILRRLLRNILENPQINSYGDLSTMLNKNSLKKIQKIANTNEK